MFYFTDEEINYTAIQHDIPREMANRLMIRDNIKDRISSADSVDDVLDVLNDIVDTVFEDLEYY